MKPKPTWEENTPEHFCNESRIQDGQSSVQAPVVGQTVSSASFLAGHILGKTQQSDTPRRPMRPSSVLKSGDNPYKRTFPAMEALIATGKATVAIEKTMNADVSNA